ncbi:dihydrolipoamide acetyltransferase family protein [Streptomyces sp. CMB-StM0423]|uniref:dihydrolipoamide acetyltransferase family protein n=1 Tax=Streptomyces sp. CMB-StM0423 TaxID=2059884 RepID=UPI000C70D4C7|nr:dihydrolipoamide acetyltransferase family protein [Streptomyces sp. CMB-StM0423]AUH41826.1 branched-chain alpha-keto acid dehydrogenase subunit E2 [Streptomyces sp. CMB-StM0423]
MPEVREFALPDLGEGLTEAEIVTWLVDVGDVIAVDQPVVEVETAKAMVEVPCPYGGVVTARHGDPGTEVPVGSVLVTVAVETGTGGGAGSGAGGGYRDRIEDRIRGAGAGPADGGPAGAVDGAVVDGAVADARASAEFAGEETGGSGNVLVGYGTSAGGTRRRRRGAGARRTPLGGGPVRPGAGAPAPRGTRAPEVPADGPVAVISPLVRRIARESGLDLRAVTGSGPHGLILRADVEAAVRAGASAGRGAAAAAGRTAAGDTAVGAGTRTAGTGTALAAGGGLAGGERVPLRGVRGAIADKLSRSRREIPDVTCWVDADATELLAARRAMNAAAGDRPAVSLLALLGRVCTAALARYPELNSTVQGREIVRLPAVHLGFAAQTDRGLVVPVVRDAHALSAERLSAEMARLTEAARAGTLTPAELTGGTFTLNNYGVFGVDGSTPILNHPEAGMLGVGRIAEKPWVHGGELAVRRVVELSFTFDHRVCDGGTAGGFLRYVADCVEHPAVLLRAL